MMKVGVDKIKIGEKKRKFSYCNVKYDRNGWADASKYLPADYDLLFLKMKDGEIISGWSYGNKWDGLNLKVDHEVQYWMKNV